MGQRGPRQSVGLPGERHGRLTILAEAERTPSGKRKALCRCECGNTTTVQVTHLRRGVSRSCGCLQREVAQSEETRARLATISAPMPRDPTVAVNLYDAVHKELRALYGPARDYLCTDCEARASQWSYSPTVPSRELTAILPDPWRGGEREVHFSNEPVDYLPRCQGCHRRHDAAVAVTRRQGAPVGA